jgi:mono/diheme cytochrome c family protein
MKKIIIASTAFALTFAACKSTKQTATVAPAAALDCSSNKYLTYNGDIKAILQTHCTKCHNTNNKAGYNFLTLESVKKAVGNGELLGTIKHLKGFPKMPAFAAKMDQVAIDKIECWINNGMKE